MFELLQNFEFCKTYKQQKKNHENQTREHFKILEILKKTKLILFFFKFESSTSVLGGNLVDGLPPAPSSDFQKNQRFYLKKNAHTNIVFSS